jgi:hypothetical protein
VSRTHARARSGGWGNTTAVSGHDMRACLEKDVWMQGRSDAHMDADAVDKLCDEVRCVGKSVEELGAM